MKSSIVPSKALIRRVEQDVYDVTVEACQDNNAMFLIALNQEFGFGEARMKRVVRAYNEVSNRYADYKMQGYSEEDIRKKMCEELAAFGVDDEQIHTGKHEFYEAQHKKKMMKKNSTPSLKEAAEAQRHMLAMKEYLNNPQKPYVNSPSLTTIQVDEKTDVSEILKNKRVQFGIHI